MNPILSFLVPGMVLSLAVLPASRGELDHLRKDVVEIRQTLVTKFLPGAKQGVERQARMKEGAGQVCAKVTRNPTEKPRG
jgi:hypothetical protein